MEGKATVGWEGQSGPEKAELEEFSIEALERIDAKRYDLEMKKDE